VKVQPRTVPVPTRDSELVERIRDDLRSMRNGPWYREGYWSISPFNFEEGVTPGELVGKRVHLVDITGRVAEQAAGMAFSVQEKLELARALSAAGVPEMTAAQAISKPKMQRHVEAIRAANLPIKISALAYSEDDLRAAAHAGAQIIEIVILARPSIDAAYNGTHIRTEDELLQRADRLITLAKSLGLEARSGINDVGYSRPGYVERYVRAAVSAGADAIQLADSSASLGPRALAHLVRQVKHAAPNVSVGVHLHNDFGLASACGVAALEAGADSFDVSVNGIGDKAGQLDLASFAIAIEAIYRVETGLKFERLNDLSRLVQDLTRTRVPPTFPISGDRTFQAVMKNTAMAEHYIDPSFLMPIFPQRVGNRSSLGLGRHSGDFGILRKADELGFTVTEDQLPVLLEDLDCWFEVHKRLIADDEVITLLSKNGCRRSTESS